MLRLSGYEPFVRIVRSAMIGCVDSITVENDAASSPGSVSGTMVARARPASGTVFEITWPLSFWNFTVTVAGWPVALNSAMNVSKKAPVAPRRSSGRTCRSGRRRTRHLVRLQVRERLRGRREVKVDADGVTV
jgi:hypothetical protein